MAAPVPQSQPYPEIPDKLYFRIGEVSQLAGVKPYVLRYWETEFAGIGPKKSGSNHRLYRRKDVELILDIKHLLYEKRYTIEGARKLLTGEGRAAARARNEARTEARSEPRPETRTEARPEPFEPRPESLLETRADNRALAKPVQAVGAVASPVALAVGAAASANSAANSAPSSTPNSAPNPVLNPVAASPLLSGNTFSSLPTPVAAVNHSPLAASGSTTSSTSVASGSTNSAHPLPTSPKTGRASASKNSPRDPDLVGSIRKELLSLLHLLAD